MINLERVQAMDDAELDWEIEKLMGGYVSKSGMLIDRNGGEWISGAIYDHDQINEAIASWCGEDISRKKSIIVRMTWDLWETSENEYFQLLVAPARTKAMALLLAHLEMAS